MHRASPVVAAAQGAVCFWDRSAPKYRVRPDEIAGLLAEMKNSGRFHGVSQRTLLGRLYAWMDIESVCDATFSAVEGTLPLALAPPPCAGKYVMWESRRAKVLKLMFRLLESVAPARGYGLAEESMKFKQECLERSGR